MQDVREALGILSISRVHGAWKRLQGVAGFVVEQESVSSEKVADGYRDHVTLTDLMVL